MHLIGNILHEMMMYYTSDVRRINHFLKVYGFAKTIAENEKLNQQQQLLVEVTAIVHDIGIKISEEKYNSSAGKYQEMEGPSVAKVLLERLGVEYALIEDVCFIVGNHHTYQHINSLPFQILVEADFLVNIAEEEMSQNAIQSVKEKIFKTKTGLEILITLYENAVETK